MGVIYILVTFFFLPLEKIPVCYKVKAILIVSLLHNLIRVKFTV